MSKKTFNLNKQLYSADIIAEAIAAFDGYAIAYADGVLTIDEEDPQYVFDEFANYILSIYSETIVWA
jgi:hypothetical protein